MTGHPTEDIKPLKMPENTMPKKVHKSLNVKKGNNIAYYEGLTKQVIVSI